MKEGGRNIKAFIIRRGVILLVSLLLVIALVLSAFYLRYAVPESDRDGTYRHSYRVEISTDSTSVYTLMLPVPRDINGSIPPGFMSEIEYDEGKIVAVLDSCEHGTALEITGFGSTNLSWSGFWLDTETNRFGNMTMTTGGEGWSHREDPVVTWIYCSMAGVKISLYHSSIHHYYTNSWFASGGGPWFNLRGYDAAEGWQQPELEYGWMLIN
jgi:hypothetical protein